MKIKLVKKNNRATFANNKTVKKGKSPNSISATTIYILEEYCWYNEGRRRRKKADNDDDEKETLAKVK